MKPLAAGSAPSHCRPRPWREMRVVALPSKSPLVTFRIVFTAGSAADPRG